MKFLNPCLDWAFKRIFGSVESRRVLLAFLNDLLQIFLHFRAPIRLRENIFHKASARNVKTFTANLR